MKIFRFDPIKLQYIKLNTPLLLFWVGIALFTLIFTLSTAFTPQNSNNISEISQEEYEKILLIEEVNTFSEENLIKQINSLNFKFPHIILAQSQLETGNYKSKIFMENCNLFGMKEARVRLNLAKGTQSGHAYYERWVHSLYDYAFWCSTYAYKCKTEKSYYELLGRVYAEDKSYVEKLKKIIKNQKLAKKFK